VRVILRCGVFHSTAIISTAPVSTSQPVLELIHPLLHSQLLHSDITSGFGANVKGSGVAASTRNLGEKVVLKGTLHNLSARFTPARSSINDWQYLEHTGYAARSAQMRRAVVLSSRPRNLAMVGTRDET
jgi:hypothetical protein